MTKLQQRLETVQRQIRHAKSEEKKQARRDDARAKIIAGALALEHTEKNPDSEFARKMLALLDEYVRPAERVLFPFLPVRELPSPALEESEAAE